MRFAAKFFEKRVDRHRSSVANRPTPLPLRGGMTLIELLVVIVLVTTLVSTAIPIISPGGEDRKLREASRGINAYFQGAQARAIETGRPFGVAMRRLSEETGRGADNAVVTRLEYVEVPPAYSGFDTSSLARICVGTAQIGPGSERGVRQLALQLLRYGSAEETASDRLPSGYDVDLVPDRYLRPGDQVQVGNSWYVLELPAVESLSLFSVWMQFAGVRNNGAASGYFDTSVQGEPYIFAIRPVDAPIQNGGGSPLDLSPGTDLRVTHNAVGDPLGSPESLTDTNNGEARYFCTAPAPFKIYRQPVPAAGEPLELPAGIAIDLQSSALVNADADRFYQPSRSARYDDAKDEFVPIDEPAMVLFSPEGNVERVFLTNQGATASSRVTDTMALCVGRRELIPPQRTEPALQVTAAVDNTGVPQSYDEPIDLMRDLNGLTEDEAREITDQYNWLNTESRWVVIGARSGAIRTVETSSVFPSNNTRNFAGQLRAALDNVQNGSKAGGR